MTGRNRDPHARIRVISEDSRNFETHEIYRDEQGEVIGEVVKSTPLARCCADPRVAERLAVRQLILSMFEGLDDVEGDEGSS